MGKKEAVTEAAKSVAKSVAKRAVDRGETVGLMDPLVLSQTSPHRPALGDLAIELATRSAGFRRSLSQGVVTALAELVRSMNCYYSNLIEGHDTHPIDIERALKKDFSADPKKRNLQLEAAAHIAVQKWIDEDGLKGPATTSAAVLEIHRRFCEHLPDELLWVEHPTTKERIPVEPGQYRQVDVGVGPHVPVSPRAVPRFVERFEQAYAGLGRSEAILGAAAAHHRLLWIHPFLDGNGRVARLMSYATLREMLETGGIWSVARGLARDVDTYKQLLSNCDLPRRNDLDGRGPLSEEALAEFTRFFLGICLDQVKFMEELVQPDKLRARVKLWADEEIATDALPAKGGAVLDAILYRGELPRGDVPGLLDTSARSARRVISALIDRGVVTATSTKSDLRIAFPAALAARWMPGLFPEKRA
jgi:Fic family protein